MVKIVQSVGTTVTAQETRIDYATFRLHYTFTVGMLLTFFILITVSQLLGDPIICEPREETVLPAINSYCWSHSTFIIPKAFFKNVPDEVPHLGIDSTKDPKEFYYLTYYQWVYFMLLFQAISFYIPRWLWKIWEGGKMKTLTKDLHNVLMADEELNDKFTALSTYLVKSWTAHNTYAAKYYFCEFLTLVNVVGQFYLLDVFFNGKFIELGGKVVGFYTSHEYIHRVNITENIKGNPILMLFPRVTKCLFRRYGASATVEAKDALCIMPLNVINEKIFIILWFWYVLLGIFTSLSLIMNFFLIISSSIRLYALQTRFYLVNDKDLKLLMQKGWFGDWLLMDMIGRNMDHFIFRDLVSEVAREICTYYKHL
ncbi:innexin shaking-B [Trichonephila clavata]|uniref:Innexin n=1 Tax=Trichonephila clavata TaxID=2740835 RepID=A0A8X6KPY6_TRICU|nr:innexin shaking-B [Trichonephila clavata]